MIKYYKLVGYDPYWTKIDKKFPREHIETILENVSYKRKTFANKRQKNDSHWIEITNVDWKAINDCTITAYQDEIPKYIKVDNNGIIYYYYLLDTPMVYASKNDRSQYKAVYELDLYMTVYHRKLEIMREHNPRVYVNKGFFNRWAKREGENTLYYFFDYVASKWIGQTQSDRNNQLIRKLAYYTTPQEIYSLNFPDTVLPESYEVKQFDDQTKTWGITNFNTKLTTSNSRGRYLYYVAKSTAKMQTSNEKLVNNYTNQKFILIPFFNDMEVDFWHGLNDFDETKTGAFLVPQGDNEIGLYECDIPYSIFYGYLANNMYGTEMKFAKQQMRDDTTINIPFFEIDNNAPILLKIIDFNRYKDGFSGKFDYLVKNITTWIPDTEPAFLNPMYYKEVYKIGDSQIVIDSSMFTYKWSANEIKNFGVEAYLSFSSGLNIAYNFGENTNTQLATLDNTETVNGTISITNMYMGSNSANYFTTNASTLATSLANRKSEESQAWADAGLDTAKAWLKVVPSTIWQAINPAFYAKKAAQAGIETAKIMTDTRMQQDRANREFKSSVNNITSAPSQTLSNSDVKGVIPNKHGLFETYSLELHPDDKDVLFAGYTHNGYPCNFTAYFNDVADNRKIMNVINLDTTQFEDDLLLLLSQYDNSFFNTKFWNNQFLAWLNNNIAIYNTRTFVNCTDYLGDNYIPNIEKELPDIPIEQTYIGKYITNFRDAYGSIVPERILADIKADNPVPPEYADIWDHIHLEQLELGGFIIATNTSSTKYYGDLVVSATLPFHLSFVAEQDNSTVSYQIRGSLPNINIQVSYDAVNWNNWDGTPITLNNGDQIWLRNTSNTLSQTILLNYFNFIMTGKISASGNVNSMINFSTLTNLCFYNLFYRCTSLTTAPELPATTLADGCYYGMFDGCNSLTTVPGLPATALAKNCYKGMFQSCSSLTTAPELPATTLAVGCYNHMFYGCTSLTQAPELPATIIADYCYSSMFDSCTSLTQAPELPATIIADYCYDRMFYNCTSLTTAPELPATTLANACYNSMFKNCTSLNVSENTGNNLICDFTNVSLSPSDCVNQMFYDTGGSFTGTPTNKKYYWN